MPRTTQRRHTPVRQRPASFVEPVLSGSPPSRQHVQERRPPAVKRTFLTLVGTSAPTTLITPKSGTQLRLVRIWVQLLTAETADRRLELYFGGGASAETDRSKIIEILQVRGIGIYSTRVYDALSLSRTPTGLRDEVITYRWPLAPDWTHNAFIEYREIITNRTD